jgi:hypothetical protein
MKAMLSKYWPLVGLIALLATSSLAQTMTNEGKVRMELERTDEVIERANDVARSSNTPMAAPSLQEAIKLQKGAWEGYRRRYYPVAYRLTMEARDLAKKAIVRSRLTEQGETVVLHKLERAAELLERAKEAMSQGSDGRLQTIYESAKNSLNRAWEFYRSQRYRAALKLANQVINAGQEILNAANRQIRKYAEFERRSEAVAELIVKAREDIAECSHDDALKLVEQADKMYQLSQELAAEDKYAAALRNLQQARKMVIETSKMCNGDDALKRRHDRIKSEADLLSEKMSTGDDTGRRLLNQVYEQLQLAEDFINRQQTGSAAAALKAAQLTLNQLKKHLTIDDR